MQRILPPAQRSVLVRQGRWGEEETLSELGIYGTFLRKGGKVRGLSWLRKGRRWVEEAGGHTQYTRITDITRKPHQNKTRESHPLATQVLFNENAGHLVRTKTSDSNEGGVAAGFAVLDSPLLARPGEGLLPVELEGGSSGGSSAGVLGAVRGLVKGG
jgi:hypothetical protein